MITVHNTLTHVCEIITGRPLFKFKFPDGYDEDSFIVVNTLGVPMDPIQTVEVNVNCYAKDLDTQKGVPDLTTLNTMTNEIITELNEYKYNGLYIRLLMTNILREQELSSHYINIRFQVLYTSN